MFFVDLAGSDPSLNVGEVGPDFYAAEVGAFGADGGGDSSAEIAWRADVTREFGEHFADLLHFLDGGLVDFFLGVEAGAHGPFMEKVEERAGFDEANRFRIGQKIEGKPCWNAAIEKLVFRGPGFGHRAFVA